MVGRRVVAAIAAIGDDADKAGADLRLDLWDDRRQRVAVPRGKPEGRPRIARQRLGVGDELAALGMMERRGDGTFHAELARAMRLALADAFDLGGVQRIDLRPPRVLALLAHPARQHQGEAEDLLERPIALDPAHDVARHPAQIGGGRHGLQLAIQPCYLSWRRAAAPFRLEPNRPGWRILAVGGSRRSAHNVGIPVRRIICGVYVLSGVLCGLGGVFYAARSNSPGSEVGTGLEVIAITAAVLGGNSLGGGRGSVVKAIIGAVTVLIVTNGVIRVGLLSGG